MDPNSMGIHIQIQVSRSRAQPPPLHMSGPYRGPSWRFVSFLRRMDISARKLHSFWMVFGTSNCSWKMHVMEIPAYSQKRWSTLKRCEYILFLDLFTLSTPEIYIWNDMQLIAAVMQYIFVIFVIVAVVVVVRWWSTDASAHDIFVHIGSTPMCFLKVHQLNNWM